MPHSKRVYGQLHGDTGNNQDPVRPPRRRWQLKFKRAWIWPIIKLGIVLFFVIFILGTAATLWVSRDLPDPNKLSDRQVSQSTKIYDRTGTHLLYEVYQNQKRTLVELKDVSPYAVKAIIAIEDKYYYEHSGVRVISILRAGFNNLIGRKTGGGGASTLTQQLIKNVVVGDSHSYLRKLKEAIMALRLERKYTKDEILKMYINEIPLGSTNYGIEAASQSYFHKKASELTIAEGATLAAMLPRPSYYLNNLAALRERRNVVLRLMFEQGVLTTEQKTAAQAEILKITPNSGIFEAPHFVLYVKQLLADQFGENIVDTGGLRVITTLDYDKQIIAQNTVKELGDQFAKDANANNAALVAMDPRTAQILSLVGSRDFFNVEIDGQFNVAVLGRRQPGSSLKPLVYTAAFEKGYTPDTVLYDVTTNFDDRAGENYTPKNYDGKEHGLVTMRSALQGSLNIPAVKTLYLVGVKDAIEFAKRFGYTTLSEDAGLSLVLGGSEVNLLEHTNGYATLADNGVWHEPSALLKVTDNAGNVLYEWKPSDGTEAVTPELAATITNVLNDDNARAYVFGHGSTLTLPGRAVAAKTGTTNDNKDAWTLGYVPSLAAGVWVGNTTPAPMKGGGNLLAGKIWNKFMRAALASTTPEKFPDAPPNDAEKPVLRGALGGIKITVNRLNGKIAVTTTPESAREDRSYLPPHDILYYVDRTDPRGPMPANPAADSQYQNWENSLQDWVIRQTNEGHPVSLQDAPTEYDTPTSPELIPTIEILSPTNSSTISSRQLEIQIRAAAPRGVTVATYRIDDKIIGMVRDYPFNLSYYARDFAVGDHTLRVTVEDDQGNSNSTMVRFTLSAAMDAPSATWSDGETLTVTVTDYPKFMYLDVFRWEDIAKVEIYFAYKGVNKKVIYTFTQGQESPEAGKLMFAWKHFPGAGSHRLTAVTTAKDGTKSEKVLGVEAN